MAAPLESGVKLSKTSPAFLHANSTSHTWIFSAIAELIDNSYDAESKTLWIDKKVIHETDALVFMDDGKGMSPQELHHMLSFGYCEKEETSFSPVGQYGNGFKSGSMRLGTDAIVFTKNATNLSVGFLSQTYLRAIHSDTILVPIISWDAKTKKLVQSPDLKGSMTAITTHSIFRSAQELTREFVSMSVAKTGTRIIIYNLKRGASNRYELDFESNPGDLINSESTMVDEFILRNEISIVPVYRRSLREYCSILFLRPRMKLVLRGAKVKTKLIAKSLSKTEKDVYNPRWLNKPVKIIFGFTSPKHDYGILMYSKNRLIKAYEKVGLQKQANSLGVGVVGVVQTDFLEPIHNKQDFNKTDHYNTFMTALAIKLNDYWHAKMGTDNERPQTIAPQRPDWNWVQCDNCLKWRRLADSQSPDDLPEKWFCHINSDPIHNRCDVPEEPEDEDELILRATYSKTFKNQKKNQRQQQIKIKEEELQQKEQYLLQVEQQLQQKASQGPSPAELQRAKKEIEEAKRREREQIQYIRMLKQREKQIIENQKKLQQNINNLVNEPSTAGTSGVKRKGSGLKVKMDFNKKQKVVSKGEDFVITQNEESEEDDGVVNLDDPRPSSAKKKRRNKKVEDVIVIDEDDDDVTPAPVSDKRSSSPHDVKPDVNELNRQMEVDAAVNSIASVLADTATASQATSGESSVTAATSAASPIPSTSNAETSAAKSSATLAAITSTGENSTEKSGLSSSPVSPSAGRNEAPTPVTDLLQSMVNSVINDIDGVETMDTSEQPMDNSEQPTDVSDQLKDASDHDTNTEPSNVTVNDTHTPETPDIPANDEEEPQGKAISTERAAGIEERLPDKRANIVKQANTEIQAATNKPVSTEKQVNIGKQVSTEKPVSTELRSTVDEEVQVDLVKSEDDINREEEAAKRDATAIAATADVMQGLKDCQAKLRDTRTHLKSLRQNVYKLLQLIVPDLEIDNLDMVEGVVQEMIRVNAEQNGQPGQGMLSPCLTNGKAAPRFSVDSLPHTDDDSQSEPDKNSDRNEATDKNSDDETNAMDKNDITSIDDSSKDSMSKDHADLTPDENTQDSVNQLEIALDKNRERLVADKNAPIIKLSKANTDSENSDKDTAVDGITAALEIKDED